MPITPQHTYKPLSQAEFGELSYQVFSEVIEIRRELGRFFDEKHYKKALAMRRSDVLLEAPILVSHGTFKKFYFLDVLVLMGGVFEFKAVEALTRRHRAQLTHYLMLADLHHGMLINVRPEKMQREYANNHLTRANRHEFKFDTTGLIRNLPGAEVFHALLVELLDDWGTCLDLGLYEEGITHFLGGDSAVIRSAEVSFDDQVLGAQNLRFVTDKTVFKLTAFDDTASMRRFQSHAQRLINHTDAESLIWANISRELITLRTLLHQP